MSLALKMILGMMKKQPPFAIGPGTDYAKQRAIVDSPKSQIPLPKSVRIEPLTLAGVPCELLTPKKCSGNGLIYYIHGGGYCYGSAFSSRGYGAALADACGLPVVTVTYRLAPEHKWPAGPEDCFAVYQALLARNPGKKIGLVGESGGGTMILVTALMAKARGVELPACIVPISPCTDLAEDLPSRKQNEGALVVPYSNIIELLNGVYLEPGTDAHDPFVSPFFGDYTGFPPMYFFADRGEVLFDDTDLLVPKIRAAGVAVQYEVMDGKFHSFPTIGRSCPESAAYLDTTRDFLLRYLA